MEQDRLTSYIAIQQRLMALYFFYGPNEQRNVQLGRATASAAFSRPGHFRLSLAPIECACIARLSYIWPILKKCKIEFGPKTPRFINIASMSYKGAGKNMWLARANGLNKPYIYFSRNCPSFTD